MAFIMGRLYGIRFLALFLAFSLGLGENGETENGFLRSVVDSTSVHNPNADSWSYKCKDDSTGPSHWADLSPDYSLCSSGQTQSPVSIESFNLQVDASLPTLDGPCDNSPASMNSTVLNDGHTVKIFRSGCSFMFRGENYSLNEFHLHTPSEHTVDGKTYPMEMHLPYVSESGAIVMVGSFFELGPKDNPKLNEYFPLFPHLKVGEPVHNVPVTMVTTAKDIFDQYYVYDGSLTEPPCTQNVVYAIFKQVYPMSPRQLKWLQDAVHGKNSRPLQPLNGRTVYVTK